MGQANIRCDAVGRAATRPPGRRAVLLAAAGLAAWPAARAAAAVPQVAFADLVAADGSPSAFARSLASSQVSVRGYLAPSLDGQTFALTEQPAAPCQLCGATHGIGAEMPVLTEAPDAGAPMLQRVEVSGTLEVRGAVRLVAARIQPA